MVRTLSRWGLAVGIAVVTGLGPAAHAAQQAGSGMSASPAVHCPEPGSPSATPGPECPQPCPPYCPWEPPLPCPPYCPWEPPLPLPCPPYCPHSTPPTR